MCQSMGEPRAERGVRGLLHLESGIQEAARQALSYLGWLAGVSDGDFGHYQLHSPPQKRFGPSLCCSPEMGGRRDTGLLSA